jgi:NADH-quinone oxidoreductase subunit N
VTDQLALLPAYAAAGTAVLVLLTDLLVPGRRGAVVGVASFGAFATAGTAIGVGVGGARFVAFCADGAGCSLVTDRTAVVIATLFASLTLGVLALSVPVLRTGEVPTGEYCFLLACSLTGGVVLGSARDLITLIVALETLTLPLYVLVGLRRSAGPGSGANGGAPHAVAGAELPGARPNNASAGSGVSAAELPGARPNNTSAGSGVSAAGAAVTFFVVSVVATAVSLLGAALLYAATGALHFGRLSSTLDSAPDLRAMPLVSVGVVLLLAGLGFKVAAVPLHAWAPSTYDGAPLPVAAYLSTASKLGGVVAVILVTVGALGPVLAVTGPVLAVLAVLTMTVGNLVALRQRRMVRLLAWSSIAQAGYILAPLGAFALHGGRTTEAVPLVLAATVAYTVFYVVLEFGAFAAVVALRGDADGGRIADYRGAARRSPWVAGLLMLALAGLAGLPPGLAGLFAKVAVIRALLGGGAAWLAVVVALNAVVGLAYYLRVAAALFGAPADLAAADLAPVDPVAADPAPADPAPADTAAPCRRVPWTVAAALVAATAAAIVVGFVPQLVMEVAAFVRP